MSSAHHRHHGHTNQCCCCCSSSSPSPSPPPLSASDQLLQLLADRLLQQFPPPPHFTPHQYPKPRIPHQTHQPNDQHHHYQQQIHSLLRRVAALESSFPHLSSAHPLPSRSRLPPPPPPLPPPPPVSLRHVAARTIHQHRDQQQHDQQQIHSLLRRVADLESAFLHRSSAHPLPSHSRLPPPPPPPPTPPPPVSLRHVAARTIQARSRRFLAGRSQNLRDLKQLAAIKSHVSALMSSISKKTQLLPEDLLPEQDCIKSGDPMIREGGRSISRELARILEFVVNILVKEQQLYRVGGQSIRTNELLHRKQSNRANELLHRKREKVNHKGALDEEPRRKVKNTEGRGFKRKEIESDNESYLPRKLIKKLNQTMSRLCQESSSIARRLNWTPSRLHRESSSIARRLNQKRNCSGALMIAMRSK